MMLTTRTLSCNRTFPGQLSSFEGFERKQPLQFLKHSLRMQMRSGWFESMVFFVRFFWQRAWENPKIHLILCQMSANSSKAYWLTRNWNPKPYRKQHHIAHHYWTTCAIGIRKEMFAVHLSLSRDHRNVGWAITMAKLLLKVVKNQTPCWSVRVGSSVPATKVCFCVTIGNL